jgi:putative tryptophan/tyrosine transport system substrate-binding protein
MRRRGFIAFIGAAAVWPLATHAQQPERVRRVGVLLGWCENDAFTQRVVSAFAQALRRFGWVEGKNIVIDYRFAAGDTTLFKPYAAELVGLAPDAILASPGPAVATLRELTHTIPIVGVLLGDPVGLGYVQSFPRPGGNITGFTSYEPPMMGKWLQLLKEIAPSVTHVAVIYNPDTSNPGTASVPLAARGIEAAAPSFGVTVTEAPVHDDAAIEQAVAAQAHAPGGGLIALADFFNTGHRDVIIASASRHNLPLLGSGQFWPKDGALMSYAFDVVDLHAQAASYIDRILKGATPADLPVQQPTKWSLIINLKTAKALGLTVPPNMLDLADEVIE